MSTSAIVSERELAKQIIAEIIRQAGGVLSSKTELLRVYWRAHLIYAESQPGYLSFWPLLKTAAGPVIQDADLLLAELVAEGTLRIDETSADGFTARTMVQWLILNPLGTLDLGTMAEQGSLTCRDSKGDYTQAFCLTINDLPVAEITGRRSAAPPLLPGRYLVALNTPTPTGWDTERALVVVSPGGTAHVDR
jgi:hypothetical protein